MEGCALIGKGGMDYNNASVYQFTINNTNGRIEHQKGYKISGFNNVTKTWDENVWKCDGSAYGSIMQACHNLTDPKLTPTKLVSGFQESSVYEGYLCINGNNELINVSAAGMSTFIEKYGCPLSALKCNDTSSAQTKKYYNSADSCEQYTTYTGPCKVVRTYYDYGDTECWRAAENCMDFSHNNYKVGAHDTLQCPDDSTTPRPYCGEGKTDCTDSTAVEINKKKCYACDCIDPVKTTRLSSCNKVLYDISYGYYMADAAGDNSSCRFLGYTTKAFEISANSHCEACPYSAYYWRCGQ